MQTHASMSFRAFVLCVLSLLVLSSCNGSGDGSSDHLGLSATSGTGHLQVLLTDAPLDLSGVSEVSVTIENVIVYGAMLPDGSTPSPVALMTFPGTFNLLELTGGTTTLLADGELSSGFYERIRLEISEAHLVFDDSTIEPLKIESNKVDIPIPFQLGVDENLELILDFEADASVQVNETAVDKYILRPVVTPVPIGSTTPT